MTGRSEQEAGDLVAAYDFGRFRRLVDVGAGHGILPGALLRAAPDLHAVLVDQPAVVEQARRRLATCRTAMPPGSRLLVVAALLPERAQDQPAVIHMDLHMLVLLGARKRTEAQYRTLLTEAGFSVERVVPTASPAGLSVLEATPASVD
jgi:xanthine/CO dehydrogenase XdhC/CoxF family maturation factor